MSEAGEVVVAAAEGLAVHSLADISELISRCFGAAALLLSEDDVAPAFFDLRSGLAGELFQKVVDYRLRLGFVLADPDAYGQRFSELVYEHRTHHGRHGAIRFFCSHEEARAWLEG